jgi:phosphodiesterase/alkaline phosphatase D-like protein
MRKGSNFHMLLRTTSKGLIVEDRLSGGWVSLLPDRPPGAGTAGRGDAAGPPAGRGGAMSRPCAVAASGVVVAVLALALGTAPAAIAHDAATALTPQAESGITPPSLRDWAYGVGAGDIRQRSALLWSRAGRTGVVVLEVARGPRFRRLVVRRRLRARPRADFTVRARVGRLKPGTSYHYRFRRGRSASRPGEFTTAFEPDADRTLRFAITGDADATHAPGVTEPGYGPFLTLGAMAAERNDFNVLNGDTIFADSNVGGRIVGLDLVPLLFADTRAMKWGHYRAGLELPAYRELRAGAALYTHWDDHEFDNDFTIPEGGREQYAAGKGAFLDYTPARWGSRLGLYRHFRWGRHLELFFLDNRSFSSAKASANGACNNPRTGAPDKLPTAPASVRLRFAAAQPELFEPVPRTCLDAIASPDRTLLGAAQLDRFEHDLRRSNATFKVVVTQPLHEFYTGPYDRWEGYAHERERIIDLLRSDGSAVLVLSNDSHAHFVHGVMSRTLEPDGPVRSGVLEVAAGPNAANTHAGQIEGASQNELGPFFVNEVLYTPPPPVGVGIACGAIDTRGYAQVEVTAQRLVLSLKDERGHPIVGHDGRVCEPAVVNRKGNR